MFVFVSFVFCFIRLFAVVTTGFAQLQESVELNEWIHMHKKVGQIFLFKLITVNVKMFYEVKMFYNMCAFVDMLNISCHSWVIQPSVFALSVCHMYVVVPLCIL